MDTIIATDATFAIAGADAEVLKGVLQKLPVQICGLLLHMDFMVTPADIDDNLVENARQQSFARAHQLQPSRGRCHKCRSLYAPH